MVFLELHMLNWSLIISASFSTFFTSKIKKQKMEEEKEQRERELVYEEMVRKYLMTVYLYLDTLFIHLSLSQETRLFYTKTIFSTFLQHFRLFYIK